MFPGRKGERRKAKGERLALVVLTFAFCLSPFAFRRSGIFPAKQQSVASPVLLVDDDLSLAQVISLAIEAAGLPVEHCSSGEMAIDLMKANSYSVVIVDLILPGGMSGIYVIDAVRNLPPAERPAVLMITGASAENLRGIDRQVVQAVIFKPLDLQLFAQMVLTLYRHVVSQKSETPQTAPRIIRTFCGTCGSEIPPWIFDRDLLPAIVNPDEAFKIWLDIPCTRCGVSPRARGGRSNWA